MIFKQTDIPRAYIIELEKKEDERGSLTRTWSKDEFAQNGINVDLVQGYTSFTKKKATMRGIHYRTAPPSVAQLTRCLTGAMYEAIVDLRPDSPTYKQWKGFEFKSDDNKMLFIPEGCAHAVLTLEDNTFYINLYSQFYNGEIESGIRYNDSAFKIKWPIPVEIVSEKDLGWEDFGDSSVIARSE